MTEWYVCYKCKEVNSYAIDNDSGDTTMPRGEWLVHSDYIVTGINSKEEAQKLLKENPYKILIKDWGGLRKKRRN